MQEPQITNRLNLPEPLVKAVTRHPRNHTPNSISVTELIQPPQMRALTVEHESELVEDASERVWSLLGTLLHGVLERNAEGLKDAVAEERLETEVSGWRVVGHYDLSEMVLDGECLTDWKLSSLWGFKDGVKREFEEQLNIYAELIRRAGRHVSHIQIVAIYRDWSKSKASREADYPQRQVQVFSVPLWTPEQATEFLEERVALHQEAEKGNYPECSKSERWVRDEKWAVQKKGVKKAVRLYDSPEAAETHAKDQSNLYVEHRVGSSVRCESYCAAMPFCLQAQRMGITKHE